MTDSLRDGQKKLLQLRWRYVTPHPAPADPRPWWRRLFGPSPHRHSHAMTFPTERYDWVFVCECGHTTTDINEASP